MESSSGNYGAIGGTATNKTDGKSHGILLIPMSVCSDLNGDGQIDDKDVDLSFAAEKSEAAPLDISKGTCYMFVSDNLSHGLWSNADTVTPAPANTPQNDLAIKLSVTMGAGSGAAWFDHPALQANPANLTFFSAPGCSDADKIEFPFDLSQKPLPTTIYMLAGPEVKKQITGDLTLNFGTVDKAKTFTSTKMKLTVVPALVSGNTKDLNAIVSYIKTNNTKYYYNRSTVDGTYVYYTAFLSKQVSLTGINAAATNSTSIHGVVSQYPNLTCVTNYSFGSLSDGSIDPTIIAAATASGGEGIGFEPPPYKYLLNSNRFFLRHYGKMYHGGTWDSSCSVASINNFPTGYLSMTSSGNLNFGSDGNDPPSGTQEGSGGIHSGTVTTLAFTAYIDAFVGSDELLIVASSDSNAGTSNLAPDFQSLIKQEDPIDAQSPSHFYQADGNASVAIALSNPSGKLTVLGSPGSRHNDFQNVLAGRLKVYMGISSKPLRN